MSRIALVASLLASFGGAASAFVLTPIAPLAAIESIGDMIEVQCPQGEILNEDVNECMTPDEAERLAEDAD